MYNTQVQGFSTKPDWQIPNDGTNVGTQAYNSEEVLFKTTKKAYVNNDNMSMLDKLDEFLDSMKKVFSLSALIGRPSNVNIETKEIPVVNEEQNPDEISGDDADVENASKPEKHTKTITVVEDEATDELTLDEYNELLNKAITPVAISFGKEDKK